MSVFTRTFELRNFDSAQDEVIASETPIRIKIMRPVSNADARASRLQMIMEYLVK